MKFEINEPGKQISTQDLIDDLRSVARHLGVNTLKQREYDANGNYSYQTQKKRFGSWLNALKEAGLEPAKKPWGGGFGESAIPNDLLIEDLKEVAKEVGKKSLTIADYDKIGRFGSATIAKRFGGWNKAKEAAGLIIGRVYNTTDEEYFENILTLWQALGRQPKYVEVSAPQSKLHISSYERKFGSWRKALEAFVEYVNSQDDIKAPIRKEIEVPAKADSDATAKPKKKQKPKKRTNRIANLRQRFRVMKRDGFKCVLCGASPATDPGCKLHIDHIVPWSKGGETIEENLRTLCSQCNLGRSNKE